MYLSDVNGSFRQGSPRKRQSSGENFLRLGSPRLSHTRSSIPRSISESNLSIKSRGKLREPHSQPPSNTIVIPGKNLF